MRPDWRPPALIAALFAVWLFFTLALGCDQEPRLAELIPAQPDHGAYARTLAKSRAAEAVRSGRLTLLEGAAAFRDADALDDGEALGDAEAYCREVIAWVRGPGAEGKARPDLADLLEAELEELRREGLRLPGRCRCDRRAQPAAHLVIE